MQGTAVGDGVPERRTRAKPQIRRLPREMLSLTPLPKRVDSMPAGSTGMSTALVRSSDFASDDDDPSTLDRVVAESSGADVTGFLGNDRSSLIISKSEMQRWQAAAAADAKKFSSVSAFCEMALTKVVAETRDHPQPSPLRVAVVSMLLDRVIANMGPQRGLVARLADELYAAIFTGWEEYRHRKSAAVRKVVDGDVPRSVQYDQDAEMNMGGTDSKISAGNLFQRQMFFQALADLQARRTQVIGRPARVLDSVLTIWRLKVSAIVFGAWRGWVRRTWSVRNRAQKYTAEKRSLKDRRRVESHFRGWRTYVFERRHQCRVVYEEQARVKLVHRMGRRIQELEEQNKLTTARYDKLFEDYCHVASKITTMECLWNDFRHQIGMKSIAEEHGNSTSDAAVASTDTPSADNTGAQATSTRSGVDGAAAPPAAPTDAEAAAADSPSVRGSPTARLPAHGEIVDDHDRLVAAMRAAAHDDGNSYIVARAAAEMKRAEEGEVPDVAGASSSEAASSAGGGRVAQLAQFLDHIASAGASTVTPTKKALAGKQQHAAAGGRRASKSRSPVRPTALSATIMGSDGGGADGATPTNNAARDAHGPEVVSLDYKTVLEWVTSRVQLFLSDRIVMKRCANFTVDFKDSTRLAYLLMSLGAERTLADEVMACKNLVERAELIVEAAAPFGAPRPLTALDIAKAKGSAIASFLFHLYSNYNHMPLVVPNSNLNPRLLAATAATNASFTSMPSGSPQLLKSAAGKIVKALALTSPSHGPASPPSANSGAVPAMARLAVTSGEGATTPNAADNGVAAGEGAAAGGTGAAEEDEPEPLPDRQYLIWYKELAADDSDADDVDPYVDPLATKRSAMDELAARLSQRTEVSRLRSEALQAETALPAGAGGKGAKARRRAAAASATAAAKPFKSDYEIVREHAARTKVRLVKWLADTINPLGAPTGAADAEDDVANRLPGGAAGDRLAGSVFLDPAKLSNADLLEAVTTTLLPAAKPISRPQPAASSPPPIEVTPAEDAGRAGSAAAAAAAAAVTPTGGTTKLERLRLRQIEQRLAKLRLDKIRLRQPQGAKAGDNVISLSQLLTALYVLNTEDAVVIV